MKTIGLGLAAAEVALKFGVGIEIDYERNSDPNLEKLEEFILAYRSVHPYDPDGIEPAARLTIDLAAGGRYLQDLNRYAQSHPTVVKTGWGLRPQYSISPFPWKCCVRSNDK